MEPKVDKTTCCLSIQCKWSQKLRNQNKQYLFQKSILSNKHKKPVLFVWIFICLFAIFFVSLFLIVVMHQTQTPQKQSFIHRICSILSFACFCDACLIPNKTSTATTTRDNSRATTNHFSLRKYGLKKLHQIFHLKIFVVFFVCINKIMRNFRHNHMTQRDVLKTIGAKENWWQRLFLAKKHKIVGKGSRVSCQMLVWVISLILLMIKITLRSHLILMNWQKMTQIWFLLCLFWDFRITKHSNALKVTFRFQQEQWAVQCGWNLRWSFVDPTILFFLKNWEVYLFDACRSWSILTISWVANSLSENYWCLLSWICSWSWFEWLWTNYGCEFGEKCSQTEFVWLLWNWWYFSIGWGCSSFGLMNWLNFFLIWCWCSQDLICPSFSLFSFGCFKCVFLFLGFCFSFWIWCSKYNKFVFQKQIQFSVLHWSMKREGTQKIHWSEKDSTQSFFNWWMKRSHTKSERKYIWIKQMQIGEIREKQGAALCSFSLSYLCLILRALTKKTRCYDCLWAQKQIQGTDWVEKTGFFCFFCLPSHLFSLLLHVKTTTTQPSKNHFLCLFCVFFHILQLLSWLFVFCCLRHQNQNQKKKDTKNLMTTLTDWHSWFFCCFLKNYHKKTNLTDVIFLWKGRMLFLEFFISS